MPNEFINQQVGAVANQALSVLHWTTLFPRLLARDIGVSGSIAVGDTVMVRVPAKLTASVFSRAAGIQIQDVTEGKVPVVMDKVWDVSVELTSEDLTLGLTDFGTQITAPAMLAISKAVDGACVALLKTTTTPVFEISRAKPVESVIDATAELNADEVGLAGRNLVVGTALAAALKKSEQLLRVDASGTGDVLREARIGRLAGADVYESARVASDEGLLFAPDGAVYASRAMRTLGNVQSSTDTYESVALRTVIDYDITKKANIASWDTLTGGAILDPVRVMVLKLAAVV